MLSHNWYPKSYSFLTKSISILLLFTLLTTYAFSQERTWTGAGSDNNWQTAANWTPAGEPATGETVVINRSATITGTASNTISNLVLSNTTDSNPIILDLNLNIGNDDDANISILIEDDTQVQLGVDGSSSTFNITPGVNQDGIYFDSSSGASQLTIGNSTTINIGNARDAIFTRADAIFTNNGSINISSARDRAIKIHNSTFANSGSISLNTSIFWGLELNHVNAVFNNSGSISTSSNRRSAISLLIGELTNTGNINLGEGSPNTAISIGVGGTINHNNGVIEFNNCASRQGIKMVGGTFNSNAIIDMTSCTSRRGINLNSENPSFENNSTINIPASRTKGILIESGNFTNTGTLTLSPTGNSGDGVALSNTTVSFINTSSGRVFITEFNGSGLQITDGTFTNEGDITIDSATGDIGIYFSSGEINNNGTLTIDQIDNNGIELVTDGTLINSSGSTLDIGNSAVTVNGGSFTNNGYFTSDYSSAATIAMTANSTCTNNAFYDYPNATDNIWGDDNGGAGTIEDNGIDVGDSNNTTFDALSTDEVNIGIASEHTWYANNDMTDEAGTNDNTGLLSIANSPEGVTNDILYTSYGDNVVLTVNNVLPVELLSFTADTYDTYTILRWATASEIDNRGFEIQVSDDNFNWETIDFIDGHGTTNSQTDYQWVDYSIYTEAIYYRLVQYDYDGQHEAYNAIRVLPNVMSSDLHVSPNPVHDQITIEGGSNQRLEIISCDGQLLQAIDHSSLSKDQVNFSQYPKGVYYLKSENEVIKLVKN